MKAFNRKRKPKHWTKPKWCKSDYFMKSRYSKNFCYYIDPQIKILRYLMCGTDSKNRRYSAIFSIENIKKYKET